MAVPTSMFRPGSHTRDAARMSNALCRKRTAGKDCGAVTAEFAMIMPAIVLVILMVIGVGTLGLAHLRSYEAARAGAREAARGEPTAEVRRSAESKAGPGSAVTIGKDGEYTVVTVTVPTPKTMRKLIPRVQAVQRARTESSAQSGDAQ